MVINDEKAKVEKGDVVLNKPEWSHSLINDSAEIMKILVFEVKA